MSKHQCDGIAVLSGAYPHMIGAIVNLSNLYNIIYVPIGMKISTLTPDTLNFKNKHVTEKDLSVQIKRDIGVTKYLGFKDMEAIRDYLSAKSVDPDKKNLVVVAGNETGLHHLYDKNRPEYIGPYNQLTQFIHQSSRKPFICYIGENLSVENCKKDLTREKPICNTTSKKFLRQAIADKASIEVAAFGWLDRKSFDHLVGFSLNLFGTSAKNDGFDEREDSQELILS